MILTVSPALPAPASADPHPLDIAVDHCKACELCISVCPHRVLALDPSVVNALGYHPIRLTDPAGCTSCVLCARICPDSVFTVYAPPRGAKP
ncbi:MAG TPA: 4Fe-4S dicluster domain-containing protein [Candidatus Limnocylindrales bacterium]|nr:4Fe-4S dicluster domain-containing protein [Candidatus Limnocylindrales bacterium]